MTKPRHTLVIAEAGVNHNGSRDMALALVDAAADAGADFVKFQTFKADKLASADAPKADYQKKATGGAGAQVDMLRRLALSEADHEALVTRCRQRGIRFLSTPFDDDSLAFLARGLKLDVLKLPSGEITNPLLLLKAAQTRRKLIVSTGMATLDEIAAALGVIAHGFVSPKGEPSRAAFARALRDRRAKALLKARVVLLHCTTEYPAPFAEVNLRAMETLRERFGLAVGYSDHTPGIAVSIAAVARGAVMIEKHLTLDRTLPGPDHRASIEPAEFTSMVAGIRAVEQALGDGRKICQPSERKNRVVARKSLVAARPIAPGETFGPDNMTAKRPGGRRSVYDYWTLLGTRAKRRYAQDEPL